MVIAVLSQIERQCSRKLDRSGYGDEAELEHEGMAMRIKHNVRSGYGDGVSSI